MHILIVDDEALARARLRTLLADDDPRHRVSEAAHAGAALALLHASDTERIALVLLDIHMPGTDGLALARQIGALHEPPSIAFVTAHAEHALGAFELDALDYLTKPVRLARLQQALSKAARAARPAQAAAVAAEAAAQGPALRVSERGRSVRVPLAEVLYLRAELKYLTLRTGTNSYVIEGSLAEYEEQHGAHLVRIHRNTLVARAALRAIERSAGAQDGEGWMVRLHGLAELLPASRRQVAGLRELLAQA